MSEEHVLQQQGDFFARTNGVGRISDLHCAKNRVPNQIPPFAVARDHSGDRGNLKFEDLSDIVEQSPGKQQIPMNRSRLVGGERVCHDCHIHSVHQQTVQKGMMNTLSCGYCTKH